jgi:hypothetical protein
MSAFLFMVALACFTIAAWCGFKAKKMRETEGQSPDFKRLVGLGLIAFFIGIGAAVAGMRSRAKVVAATQVSPVPAVPVPPDLARLQEAQAIMADLEGTKKRILELAYKGNVSAAETLANDTIRRAGEAQAGAAMAANSAVRGEIEAAQAAAAANQMAAEHAAKAAGNAAASEASKAASAALAAKSAATREAATRASKLAADIGSQAKELNAQAVSVQKTAQTSRAVLGVMGS